MADPASLIRQPRTEPTIRTMKSDVAEFLKTTKPSLVSILAEQARSDAPLIQEPSHRKTWLLVVGAIAFAGIITTGILSYLQTTKPSSPAHTVTVAPAPLIFFDRVSEVTIAKTRKDLLGALVRSGAASGQTGSFDRLVIRADDPGHQNPVLGIEDLFSILGANPPSGFNESITGVPQLFIYHEASGPHLGIILEARNPSRVVQALLTWEPSLQQDLDAFFLGKSPPGSLKPFIDTTYRNIDFRYLALDPTTDIGIGYLQFNAKHLIVIATSEETLRLTVNRLFENR